MRWSLSIALFLVAFLPLAHTQDEPIPPCVNTCLNRQSDCTTTDVTCICTSTSAQNTLQQCVTAACTRDDQAAALRILNSVCGAIGITPSLSLSSASSTNGPIESDTAPTTSTPEPSSSGTGGDDEPSPASRNSSNPPIGAIVGGVLGGLAAFGFLSVAVFLLLRRKRQERVRVLLDADSTVVQPPMGQTHPVSLDPSSSLRPHDSFHNDTTPLQTSSVTPTGEIQQRYSAYNTGNPGSHASSGSDLPTVPAGGTALTAWGMFYGSSDAKMHLRPSGMGAASSAASASSSAPSAGTPTVLPSGSAPGAGTVTEALARLSLDQLRPAQREIVASLQEHGVVGAAIADVVAKMIRENQQSGQPSTSVTSHAHVVDAPPGYDFKEARGQQ